ncbi:hypothetical protein LPJ56_005437 [Coemansia sp. RSA 2599]|nr:hypothetical protein LPJ56_005437 [Coemansia sp. RSA 2599]
MDKQGEFRGQAKVTLASGEEMIAALDKNGQKAEGSFISVHVFKQRGKDGTQGRPSLPNRARKAAREVVVRVTGFSPETGNKQLEAIAKGSGGTVVRVRRNQQGDVAFVAMKSLSDAQGAVEALNGCLVQGATLAAAVDGDGQAAQGRAAGPQGQSASLSASAKDMPMKAKTASNAAIGLVPRKASSNRRPAKRINVAKNAMPAVSEPEGQAAPGSTTDAGPSEDHAPADPSNTQTNADFRNLFLGQGSSSEKQ